MSFFKMNGVSVPHFKNTATLKAVAMPAPSSVVIPMNMHIGAPAKPVVKAGDVVGVGQLIGEAGGFGAAGEEVGDELVEPAQAQIRAGAQGFGVCAQR